jgi:hypothetical protein
MREGYTRGKGKKYDEGKPRFDLIPPDAMLLIADVFTYGAKKYGENNWQGVEPSTRYLAAAYRHLNAYQRGETLDEGSGLNHLGHAIASLIMFYCLEKELEDMFVSDVLSEIGGECYGE